MKRVPILPTIMVVAAAAVMVALGIWQLQRAEWKRRLLVQYAEAASLPPVDLDPLLNGRKELPPLGFRRALITCNAVDQVPEVHVGRNGADEPGQVYIVHCRPGAAGLAGRIMVNSGWSPRPDALPRLTLAGIVVGRLGSLDGDRPIVLTAASAVPPLEPSQPPTMANVPNNHMAYAFQWFAFALTALVIYFIALRRRWAPKLPPEP